MGEVRWGCREKDHHSLLAPPIKGGEKVAKGLIQERGMPMKIFGQMRYVLICGFVVTAVAMSYP